MNEIEDPIKTELRQLTLKQLLRVIEFPNKINLKKFNSANCKEDLLIAANEVMAEKLDELE